MSSDLNFDATKVKPSTGKPDPIPNGDYRLAVVESEVKPTNAGTGKRLELKVVVVEEGPYKGRPIWQGININNPSEKAQAIGQAELSALCHATGVLQLKNSSQLHNIPFVGKVCVTNDKDYGPKNEIKKFAPIAGGAPAATSSIAPAAASAPAANAPAWAKKAS